MAGKFTPRVLLVVSGSILFLLLPVMLRLQAAEQQSADVSPPASPLFLTSSTCIACHNGLVAPSGEDVSFGTKWRSSIMANSARDPYWQAAVRREVMDHPESQEAIENECAACHMPMSRYEAKVAGKKGGVFRHLPIGKQTFPQDLQAEDGVSCALCHQIEDKNLGDPSSFTGGFVVDTTRATDSRQIFGPYQIEAGHVTIMRSATGFIPTEAAHIQKSEVCATCHTLITHSLGPGGKITGELSEQVPYAEWLHSDYRDVRSCQSCHMPVVAEPVPISSVLGRPRNDVSKHVFTGGNFFLLRMLNRYRDELGIVAPFQELDTSAARTISFLQGQSATVSIVRSELSEGELRVEVRIENLSGHKLPTAYPSRRVWLHVTVRDRQGYTVFESGRVNAEGSIQGNDNDLDASKYEQHYQEIGRNDQVQIYESIMVDPAANVTTGLLTAVRYAKDNRLLPRGFDKSSAAEDIAVHGGAGEDPDFTGGEDVVRYAIDVRQTEGPFDVVAELYYQSIAYRWAQNLKSYDADETRRFVSYYESMATKSAIVLARSVTNIP